MKKSSLRSIIVAVLTLTLLPFTIKSYAKETNPVIITNRYQEALQFAYELHHQQTRKGSSIPYLSHLEGVASIVWKNGGTETEAIAALLHDAAEDQGGLATLKRIESKFGKEVAQIVADCSDTFEEKKPDWLTRKQNYINSLPNHSPSTLLVSAADKLDNIRDINREYDEVGEELWSKFTGTKEQTIWYYRSLAEIYVKHGPKNIGKEILVQLALLEAKMK